MVGMNRPQLNSTAWLRRYLMEDCILTMSTLPNLLRSLLLTSIFSFLAPVLFISIILATTAVISYLPPFETIGSSGLTQIAHFLQIFGNGNALHGLTVIGLVGSLVGILFDTYTFYRFQTWKNSQ